MRVSRSAWPVRLLPSTIGRLRTEVLRALSPCRESLRLAVLRRSLRSTLPRSSRWGGPLLLLRWTRTVRHRCTGPLRCTANRPHRPTRDLRSVCLPGSMHLRSVSARALRTSCESRALHLRPVSARPLRTSCLTGALHLRRVLVRPLRTTLQRRSPILRLLLGMLARIARRLALRPAATRLLPTEHTGLLCMLTGTAERLPAGTAERLPAGSALLRGLRPGTAGLLCTVARTTRLLPGDVRRAKWRMRGLRGGTTRWLLLLRRVRADGCRRGCTDGWCLAGPRRRRRRGSGCRRLSEQRISPTAQSIRLTTSERVRRTAGGRVRRTGRGRVRRTIRTARRRRWGCAVPGRVREFVLSQR
jgi:hypothetical protein